MAAARKPNVLPWPYVAILVAELLALLAMYIAHPSAPPLRYEIGWIATGSMLLMQVYSLRRRIRVLWRFGNISHWLQAHIFLGLQGFLGVIYHSVGINIDRRIASINLLLVTVVVASGIFGRYLYGLLPRTHHALSLRINELDDASADESMPGGSMLRQQSMHRMKRLSQGAKVISSAEKLFAHWTLLHRPLAFLVLGITFLHVLAHFVYAG
jgi:hypothetical protein